MARSLVVRVATLTTLGLWAVLSSGCCKEPSSDSGGVKPEPVTKTGDNSGPTGTIVGAGAGDTPAPTPAPADTNSYQSNGFPAAMPKTRTPAPNVSEWSRAPEITTKKFPEGCRMKFVREWLKINCSKDTNTATPMRIANIQGMGGEGSGYFKFEKEGKVLDIVVRTIDGKKGTAMFVTDRGSYLVGYDWPYRAPFPSTVFQ